jgi:hypothetical protein
MKRKTEPEFFNVHEAQESISPGWESILGLLKRFTNTGSGFVLGIRVLAKFHIERGK